MKNVDTILKLEDALSDVLVRLNAADSSVEKSDKTKKELTKEKNEIINLETAWEAIKMARQALYKIENYDREVAYRESKAKAKE
jgi:hypothetical protein